MNTIVTHTALRFENCLKFEKVVFLTLIPRI